MRRTRRTTILIVLAAALTTGGLLAGCGGGGSGTRSVSLVLDFTPNAVHAGIYEALARGDDRAAGIRLHVIAPSASTDALRLLQTGRVDFAILDIHDLALARAKGQNVVGVTPIVQRPLAAVIAAPGVRSPHALVGDTVGVTGDPSDTAVLHSIVAGSGGDPTRLRTITIGFDAVGDLLAGRVAAATAFWNDEGVVLRTRRPGFHIFRVDDYGAPSYPELVVCASGRFARAHPGLVGALRRTLTRGYDATLRDPSAAAAALEVRVPGLDRPLVAAELRGLLPAFAPVGRFQPARLRAWAAWERRFGIVSRTPDVAAMFPGG
ncbi:MAG: ABC transporter substrate-binding protein [Solirubrobacterales bacterium]|nr:ABC transporter substrate-binding protein [Solirubrobacterales bacterium]